MENTEKVNIIHAYAGIGSREINSREREQIIRIAGIMLSKGYLLYSGGAGGSDNAFETGSNGCAVSFRPWNLFGDELHSKAYKVIHHTKESIESVYRWHPAPNRLSTAGKQLMSRNYFQVNGLGELPKVDFVICCASVKNGDVSGGTRQAVRIANSLKIPVINIRSAYWESYINRIPTVSHVSKADLEERLRRLQSIPYHTPH